MAYTRDTYPPLAPPPPSQVDGNVPHIAAGWGPLPQVAPLTAGVGNRINRTNASVSDQQPTFQAYTHN